MLNAIFGFLSGIISGLGIGGGVILIPLLAIFTSLSQHQAQGINLAYFLPTAVAALIIHIKNKEIKFKYALKIIIFSLPWAFAASYLSVLLKPTILRRIFAVFLFITGVFQLFSKEKENEK